jgi:hypothetical protein
MKSAAYRTQPIASLEDVNMATAKTIPLARHSYADGAFKQMLIDGRWVDAASGKRFESRNPATGELLATVAEGDAADIDRAGRGASSSPTSASRCC